MKLGFGSVAQSSAQKYKLLQMFVFKNTQLRNKTMF